MLSSIVIGSLLKQYFSGWAIGLCVDEVSSRQLHFLNKGCHYERGLSKIATAKHRVF